jgi:exodeoxyribonuclease V alpha subunit
MHNKDNLVHAKMIIVDETSMVDIYLAAQLFQSIPRETKIVIVGDKDQLPSVGPGQVLHDLLQIDDISSVVLDTIFRQASNSHIVDLAYHINASDMPRDLLTVYDDRLFVKEASATFQDRLVKSIQYLINQGYDLYEDIQVLIPMYRGKTGIDQVNALMQSHFNQSNGHLIEHTGRVFKTGDKVIQLSNQVEDGIMNGDQGIIIGVTKDKHVVVDFDGNEVTYSFGDLIHLKHAYAISIHKSQGSEYKVVVMPVFKNYTIMLNKKLLYTAVTRAKEKLIVLGDPDAFKYGLSQHGKDRQSLLPEVIQSILNDTNTTSETVRMIDDPTIPFDTLGEEIDEDITPYSFLDD